MFQEAKIKELTATLTNEGKTAVACIHFMLSSAARFSCTEAIFGEEIQQLGLPKDHAAAMCRVLQKHSSSIRQTLMDKAFSSGFLIFILYITLRLIIYILFIVNELQSVRDITSPDTTPPNCATLEFKISQELVDGLPQDTTHVLTFDRVQMRALLAELKLARDVMEKYENKDS